MGCQKVKDPLGEVGVSEGKGSTRGGGVSEGKGSTRGGRGVRR